MNVLVLALDVYSGTGGIQAYLRRTVRALAEEGVSATVAALWDGPENAADAPGRLIAGERRKARFVRLVVRRLRKERPDVVILGHVLLWPLALLARLVGFRGRVVLLAYGDDVWYRPPLARRIALRRAVDEVVAVSTHTAERMERAYRLAASRFTLLEPAIDLPEDSPPPTNRLPTLLTVSRLADRYKKIDHLILALPRIRRTVPGARLVVVGDGPLRGELESLAESLGLGDAVRFAGTVSETDLDAEYRNADVFALPSAEEGYGIVFLEAWARGLPVIAADRGAAGEVVTDGRTGLLVDPDDIDAIAVAVAGLLADPGRRRAMGAAGKGHVKASHTHEHFRERLRGIVRAPRRPDAASVAGEVIAREGADGSQPLPAR